MRLSMILVTVAAAGGASFSSASARVQASGAIAADTNAASRDSLMNVVLREISGKEQLPAESVFKNIKVFRGVPAGNIPRLMNLGYGRSLGVSCAHCHVVGEWEKEDKPQKQIAREMAAMASAINTQYLARIANLKSEKPIINCSTCHRGDVKPAINMPPDPKR
jgi:hypothetical protein